MRSSNSEMDVKTHRFNLDRRLRPSTSLGRLLAFLTLIDYCTIEETKNFMTLRLYAALLVVYISDLSKN
jgi:hypothetical protein